LPILYILLLYFALKSQFFEPSLKNFLKAGKLFKRGKEKRRVEMRGREERNEWMSGDRRDSHRSNAINANDCLIYISSFVEGEEKILFVKIIGRLPVIARGRCPHCRQYTNFLEYGSDCHCLACGAVCEEQEIVRESLRRWWL